MSGGVQAPSVEQAVLETLEGVAAQLAEAHAPEVAVDGLRALARQVGQPCVLAVVGQVNAGKSTFINALLGGDLAVVGNTETTATISHFVYGHSRDSRPVRCYWRGGRVTEESTDFLAGLQGTGIEALERADQIDRLEYLVPNPLLRTVTLVDTPGTGAVVAKHESRTAAFLALEQKLRERHDAETTSIHDKADAIVYLVGAVARASDQELLDQFVDASGTARAMNALGVIAKVDLSSALLERRHELARKIARQLEDQLNDVVPVSAGVARALDRLVADDGSLLRRLSASLQRMSRAHLDLFLQNEELFCAYDTEACPVAAPERAELRKAIGGEWRVFATILDLVRESTTPDEAAASLRELAGFDRLRNTLQEHFLERAQILRCYRIVRDAQVNLEKLWYQHLVPQRHRSHSILARLIRFQTFVDDSLGESQVAQELLEYLQAQIDLEEGTASLEATWKKVEAELADVLRNLAEHHADFGALQELQSASDAFKAEEAEELRALLGMYGGEVSRRMSGVSVLQHAIERQIYWRLARDGAARGSKRRTVADRAHSRLGLVINELEETEKRTQRGSSDATT